MTLETEDHQSKHGVHFADQIRKGDVTLSRIAFALRSQKFFALAFTQSSRHGDSRHPNLIGGGCDALIPSVPLKEALEARRRQANEAARGDHVHTVANPGEGRDARREGRDW